MFRQDSDKTPVTFHDVAACFSEDEWKLLHEWQKELYRNVMKEIHQALISLGPLIATSVFSLRAKETEERHPVDNQDSDRRHGVNRSPRDMISSSDVEFRVKGEENIHLKNPQHIEGSEINDYLCTGFSVINSDMCLRQEEESTASVTNCGTEESGNGPSSDFLLINSDVCLRKEESSVSFNDHHGAAGGEGSTDPSSGYEVVTSVVSFTIKEEGDTDYKDHQDIERRERINNLTADPAAISVFAISPNIGKETQPMEKIKPEGRTTADPAAISVFAISPNIGKETQPMEKIKPEGRTTADPAAISVFAISPNIGKETQPMEKIKPEGRTTGDGAIDRTRIGEDFMENAAKNTQSKALSGKIKAKGLRSSEKGKHSRCHLWSESNQDPVGEKTTQRESDFNNLAHSEVYQGTPEVNISDTSNECESSLWNENLLACQPIPAHQWRPYTCNECQQSFCVKGELRRHQRIHFAEKPRPEWREEKNNTFSMKSELDTLTRYGDCEKSFSLKRYLNGQRRTHSGEKSPTVRPFVCTECEKSFSLKGCLLRHQKTHAGVRPYACTECEKSFAQKGDLTIHKRTHTGEKPYTCTYCQKSFSRKGNLNQHKRTHTGERPYKCSQCDKIFSRKGRLHEHQRKHTGEKPYKCNECEKRFCQKDSLSKHRRTHTGPLPV